MKNNRVTKKSIILSFVTIGLLIFIFGHSAMPSEISATESGGLTDFLQKIADFLGIELVVSEDNT